MTSEVKTQVSCKKIFNELSTNFCNFKSIDPLKFQEYEDEFGMEIKKTWNRDPNIEHIRVWFTKIKDDGHDLMPIIFTYSAPDNDITLKLDFGCGTLKYKNSQTNPYTFYIYAICGFIRDNFKCHPSIYKKLLDQLFKIKWLNQSELIIEKDVKSTSIHD